MTQPLSIDRYRTLLAAYGARLELWPDAEREAAQLLLESSAEARELSRAESELDLLFAGAQAPALSTALSRKLSEVPLRHAQPQTLWPFRRILWPVLGWAAAAVLGIVVGSVAPDPEAAEASNGTTTAEQASAADEVTDDMAASDDEERELVEMALGPTFELEETP